jgi:uncharacterized protein YkwD
MRSIFFILFLFCTIHVFAQAPAAAPYLARVTKYNEASLFEDARYKEIDWAKFYKMDEPNELVDPVNYDFDLLNAAMFYAVNKYRASKGIAPFKFDPRLRDAATIHSYEMVKRNFFDHINYYDEKIISPDKRMELCGYQGQKLAENLARSYADRGRPLTYTQLADKVVMELSKSKEHNRHLLDPTLEKLGCAAVFEGGATPEGVVYFRLTQDFGRDWH